MSITFAWRKGLVLAGVCMFFMLSAKAAAEDAHVPSEVDLTKVTPEERDKETTRLTEVRFWLIEDLLGQLETVRKGSGKGTEHIIYLLGQLRAVKAVKVLTDMIDYKATIGDDKNKIARWGPFPAQEALSNIGMPAVDEILRRIGKEADAARRDLMCIVIHEVVGTDVGRFMLARKFEAETIATNKANLQAALDNPILRKEVPAKPAPAKPPEQKDGETGEEKK